MELPTEIPTDVEDLTTLIAATPAPDRHQIADRLEKQLGDPAHAFTLYDKAETDVTRSEEIARLRSRLDQTLTAAAGSLRAAESVIARLTSNEVYDVEYAENTVADDLQHLVAEAHRATRIATALNKDIS
ncbi:hypothetical protein ACH4VR_29440 [Streptomyces sp. NPDC020883]|uniref:hypothetical protein n=1 Tax=Streptomyces sp. NPDC020883 TaxID=3365099 RepID=UPI0037ACB187